MRDAIDSALNQTYENCEVIVSMMVPMMRGPQMLLHVLMAIVSGISKRKMAVLPQL